MIHCFSFNIYLELWQIQVLKTRQTWNDQFSEGWSRTVVFDPSKNWSFHACLILRNWLCHNSSYILKMKQWPSVFCAVISKGLLPFNLLKLKKQFFILHMLRIHTGLRKLSKTNIYAMDQIRRFCFILPKIDHSTSA